MSDQGRIPLICLIYKLGNYVVIIPTEDSFRTKIIKQICLVSYYLFLTYLYCKYSYDLLERDSGDNIHLFLHIFSIIVNLCAQCSMMVAYCFKLQEWKVLAKFIKKSGWRDSKITNTCKYAMAVLIAIIHFGTEIAYIYFTINGDENLHDLIYLSLNFVYTFHVLVYNLIAWQVVLFIGSKYKNLTQYLKCPVKFESYDVIVARKLTNLCRLIGKFNEVFGNYLFFRIILLVVNILILVCHYMKASFGASRLIATSAIECYNTLFCLSFILACEKSEIYFEELIQTSIYLHVDSREENARYLTNLAKDLRPIFSAAGFFVIHQKILTTVFSNITMYLIIILQFKFSKL